MGRSWIIKLRDPQTYFQMILDGRKRSVVMKHLYENERQAFSDKIIDKDIKWFTDSLSSSYNRHKKMLERKKRSIMALNEWMITSQVHIGQVNGYEILTGLAVLLSDRIQKMVDFERSSGSPVPLDISKDVKELGNIAYRMSMIEKTLWVGSYSPEMITILKNCWELPWDNEEDKLLTLIYSQLSQVAEKHGIKRYFKEMWWAAGWLREWPDDL